ncbi:MAG TPA: AraD1 family protein [Bauldia sp.]|nr:AraD1 family protein [Bauldia sp.]
MRLMQVRKGRGGRRVVATDDGGSWFVEGFATVYELALAAIARGTTIEAVVRKAKRGAKANPARLLAAGQVVAPIEHADPAHLIVTGTGLTHLGSAATRDAMHQKVSEAAEETLTDSMRMFRMGLEGGKPRRGKTGVQPEWFYKGDGSFVADPGTPLVSPAFAEDAGEEPEVAGIYVVARDGTPFRVGFALLNEFSDHVTERQNYLWLAHSKLRPCSFGPEILLGDLPDDVRGTSRIRRGKTVIFEQPFLTGEANMSHSIANLEAHHFKYPWFRRPGDVHVHSFGTATLSFAAGIRTRRGDVFEIEAAPFGLPLTNPLAVGKKERIAVRAL